MPHPTLEVIPVTVLTGFLDSGKTSLLSRMRGERLLCVKDMLALVGEHSPVVIHGMRHLFLEPVRFQA